MEKLKIAHQVVSKHVDQQLGAFRTVDAKERAQHAIAELREILELKSLLFDEQVRVSTEQAITGLDQVLRNLDERKFALAFEEPRDNAYAPPRRLLAEAISHINRVEVLMRTEMEAAVAPRR